MREAIKKMWDYQDSDDKVGIENMIDLVFNHVCLPRYRPIAHCKIINYFIVKQNLLSLECKNINYMFLFEKTSLISLIVI